MQVVMGAAIVHAGRLLAARRDSPPELAGRWELPGGKVEPGEDQASALVREIGEELGCTVEVTEQLEGEEPISDRYVLRVALARLVGGEPHPREHAEVRWVDAAGLDELDWLGPDRPFLPQLRAVLENGRTGRSRR